MRGLNLTENESHPFVLLVAAGKALGKGGSADQIKEWCSSSAANSTVLVVSYEVSSPSPSRTARRHGAAEVRVRSGLSGGISGPGPYLTSQGLFVQQAYRVNCDLINSCEGFGLLGKSSQSPFK